MVRYVGSSELRALIERETLPGFIRQLCDRLRADFRRWETFEKSARLASHSQSGVIELMPTSDGVHYAFKYVNGHPINTETGRLTVTAFGVLADVATGYPLLISEMTVLTALRTAATSAMAARALARPNARRMALIGAGAQAEFQAIAFEAELGIREVTLFDPDRAAVSKTIGNLAQSSALRVIEVASIEEAVRGADIITTATAAKRNQTVLRASQIEPGQHINAIGGDCPGKTELAPDVLERARVFVEFPAQTRIEGEIQQMAPDFPVTELWRVLAGLHPGRENAQDITLFDSVGFAIEDFSTLSLIENLIGSEARALDLVPELVNPKNLFGALKPAA
jgi:ornithine cyclodeaminase